ncbi:MAG: hypothetical protein HND44_19660 [Chloroflexi bacterium]|nr:hypothetical protein [Ardenticatenaceae bacterium]MBL1130668.1 hypothetical protein [Chloroflexota bacterium]NOG36762.1 hypothetical protein [Chloroflexota bacterium]
MSSQDGVKYLGEAIITPEIIGSEYVRLALAIDQHIPGYIEAYFGPAEWQEQVQTDGPRPLPELTQQASTLAAAIADAAVLDDQRREFLTLQVKAMQTSLRLLQGETLALADEVESLYDVRPTWVEESLFIVAPISWPTYSAMRTVCFRHTITKHE